MLKVVPLPIRAFKGVNRRDGGDLVSNQQFYLAQNWYQALRGLWYKRYGTTHDLQSADLYGASRVTAAHRYYDADGERHTLYHCLPDTTIPLPQPTTDLTLTEIAGGDLFDGGAVSEIRVCYSWFGFGIESNFNTRTRTGYDDTQTQPWNQPGHQAITVSANTQGIRATVPAFPSGVRGANIFISRGNSTYMTYVGSVTTSGGSLDILCFIAPNAAFDDPFAAPGFTATGTFSGTGTLKPGAYQIGVAWVTDSLVAELERFDISTQIGQQPKIKFEDTFVLAPGAGDAIEVTVSGPGASPRKSANGATHAYVFIGRKTGDEFPLTFAGIVSSNQGVLTISSLPRNNAGAVTSRFYNGAFTGSDHYDDRHAFILAKKDGGSVYEIPVSRSYYVTQYDFPGNLPTGVIMGSADKYGSQDPLDWGPWVGGTYYEPTMKSFLGLVFFANGVNNILQMNEMMISGLIHASGTSEPPRPGVIEVFKNQIIAAASACKSQVYGCNAYNPYNWADGGSGLDLRFVTIGDGFSDPVQSLGIFSFTTGQDSPSAFFLAMKKRGTYAYSDVPDASSGINASMTHMSGEVGCVAYRSVCSTIIGTIFLGSDGDIYVSRDSGEPKPIGTAVKTVFSHLVGNDTLMRKVTAVCHDGRYKIFYPSSSSSTSNDAQLWADLPTPDKPGLQWEGPHTGINVGAQLVYSGAGDDGRRIGCRPDALGTVRLDDTSTLQDLGTDISAVLEWKTTRFGAEANNKRIIGMHLDAYYDVQYSHSVLLEMFADDEYHQVDKELSSGSGTWDSSSWNSANWGGARFFPISCLLDQNNLIGRTFKWKLTHSNNAQLILAAATIFYKPERRIILT